MYELTQGIAVTEQVQLHDLEYWRQKGFATVIDLRPDGEAVSQPTSEEMRSAASALSLEFNYVPIPMSGIPADAVTSLHAALANSPRPILLYCRSGSRAALFGLLTNGFTSLAQRR